MNLRLVLRACGCLPCPLFFYYSTVLPAQMFWMQYRLVEAYFRYYAIVYATPSPPEAPTAHLSA